MSSDLLVGGTYSYTKGEPIAVVGKKALTNNMVDSAGNTALGGDIIIDAKGVSPGWLRISSDGNQSANCGTVAPSTSLYVKSNDWWISDFKQEAKRKLRLSDEDILRMGGPLSTQTRKSAALSIVLYHLGKADSASKHFYARRAGWKEGMRVTYRVNNDTPMLFLRTRDGKEGPWSPSPSELFVDDWELYQPTTILVENAYADRKSVV